MQKLVIAIHGGAGDDPVTGMTPVLKEAYHHALTTATNAGYEVLAQGGSAIDAVETALRYLEDSPLFNAGRGSAFTDKGTHEMDAAIMCGRTLRSGAIAAVKHIKNPITLARSVMEFGRHLYLVAHGAEEFAQRMNMERMPEDYFYAEHKYVQWKEIADQQKAGISPAIRDHGTAGAVALDRNGDLAAGTSTGGLSNKMEGRVGDSSVIGAGTFADNTSCAVSCSGTGEYMIRTVAAHELSSLVKYAGHSVTGACRHLIWERLDQYGGDAGIMALDAYGNFHFEFNTKRFYRGWRTSDGHFGTAIYKDS